MLIIITNASYTEYTSHFCFKFQRLVSRKLIVFGNVTQVFLRCLSKYVTPCTYVQSI